MLIISGIPRKNGNTVAMVDRFAAGTVDAGHQIEVIHLREKRIGYCVNCGSCRNNKTDCVITDMQKRLMPRPWNVML